MKCCIVTIGYDKYLMPNETQGSAAIKALSKALKLRSHYLSGVGEIFIPDTSPDRGALAMHLVDKSQVRLDQKRLPERTEAA